MSKRYRALVGLSYPTNPRASRENWVMKHVAAGDVVDDIPGKSVKWLLDGGRIEKVADDPAPPVDATDPDDNSDAVTDDHDDDGEVDASGEARE